MGHDSIGRFFDFDIGRRTVKTQSTIGLDQIVENKRVGQLRNITLTVDTLCDCQEGTIPSCGITAFNIKDSAFRCQEVNQNKVDLPLEYIREK